MIIFISGGAKSGKSSLGQQLSLTLAKEKPHYYVATMIPCDEEDRQRIQIHIKDRQGMGFETIECGKNILCCLEKADKNGTFLLDSVTALLMNELFTDPISCKIDINTAYRCADEIVKLVCSVENAVVISDYIYSEAKRYTQSTEMYRKCLAYIDRKLAEVSDTVIEVFVGNVIIHKGQLPI